MVIGLWAFGHWILDRAGPRWHHEGLGGRNLYYRMDRWAGGILEMDDRFSCNSSGECFCIRMLQSPWIDNWEFWSGNKRNRNRMEEEGREGGKSIPSGMEKQNGFYLIIGWLTL